MPEHYLDTYLHCCHDMASNYMFVCSDSVVELIQICNIMIAIMSF